MEDNIYDDLENYNDVNIADELKSENKELKDKLEEKTAIIEQLQKNILQDLETLSTEYKKLQLNYSSLLTTARAEIERKTKIITNLNIEKDSLVVNSLKNSNANALNIRRNFRSHTKTYSNSRNESDSKEIKKPKDDSKSKDSCLPSEDTITSHSTDSTNRGTYSKNKLESIESCSDKNGEMKENVMQVKHKQDNEPKSDVKIKSQSIKNRRKSMPVLSKPNKLTSDEESDHNYNEKSYKSRQPSSNSGGYRNDNKEKNTTNRLSIRTYEATTAVDKYHESSKDKHRIGHCGKYENERYRPRDKSSHRLRKHSPDRSTRRSRRHHSNGHHRSDHGPHRNLESPPPCNKKNYESRSRERRPFREKSIDHDILNDFHDKRAVKQKIQDDIDQPQSKRVRTDLRNLNLDTLHREREIDEEQRKYDVIHDMDLSCQSPDYLQLEHNFPSQPKEIKTSSATCLEDPRITSKKYILKPDSGTYYLSTVSGRNVNIITVDKNKWNLEKLDMPDALKKPPPSQQLFGNTEMKEIESDFDKPSCVSVESGEIASSGTNEFCDTVSECSENCYNYDAQKTGTIRETTTISNIKNDKPTTFNLSTYKIPKAKNKSNSNSQPVITDTDSKSVDKRRMSNAQVLNSTENSNYALEKQTHPVITGKVSKSTKISKTINSDDVLKNSLHSTDKSNFLQSKEDNAANTQPIIIDTDLKSTNKSKTRNTEDVSCSNFALHVDKSVIIKGQEKSESTLQQDSDNQTYGVVAQYQETKVTTLSKKELVQLDLELSDETLDDIDEIDDEEKIKDDKKGHKIKKKTKTKKSASFENKDVSEMKEITKMNVTNVISTPIKSNLNDLFGDSTSLITPEDLAKANTQVHVELSEFIPTYEDAQDAVELEIIKVETRLSKVKTNSLVSYLKSDVTDQACEVKPQTAKESKDKKMKKKGQPVPVAITNNPVINDSNVISSVYNNSETSSCRENGIVKTVIISSGVQPQFPVIDCENQSELIKDKNTRKHATNTGLLNLQNIPTEAFATSTPMRHGTENRKSETESKHITELLKPATACYTKDNISNTSPRASVSADSKADSQNETDIPDVRLFVRRRRKVVKKT